MEIRDTEKVCILAPLNPVLDSYESSRILKRILADSREIALDLRFAHDCTIEFIEMLKEAAALKNIGVFNIPSDIFALFNFMQVDKFARLFVSETDFEEETRQLINRQFAVL